GTASLAYLLAKKRLRDASTYGTFVATPTSAVAAILVFIVDKFGNLVGAGISWLRAATLWSTMAVNPRGRTGKVQDRALGCADDSHVALCQRFSMGAASIMIGLPREGLPFDGEVRLT
ncbi:hypothetical protein TOPH_03511, partial [Tolypocladium ophioglossoides CBS 100239]